MSWRPAALALLTVLGVAGQAAAQAPPPVIPFAPAAAPAAAPAPPRPNADLRCMIIANAIGAQSKDQREKSELQLMIIYYLGKVERGTPNLNLGPALQAQDALLRATPPTPAQAQAQAKSCFANFQGRMAALQALMRPPPGAAPATAPATPAPK